MALCGVAETPQINCHSWPFLSHFFFAPPLPDSFFLPPFFLPPGYNWGSLYGLIKQPPLPPPPLPPATIGSLRSRRHFMRNACPCLNVLVALTDIPVFLSPPHQPAEVFKKKFQNIGEKRAPASGIVLAGPASKHIWLRTYCFLRDPSNVAARISTVLFFLFFLLPLTVAERNVIWQTNVVTDSLSGGFYGSSALLVTRALPSSTPTNTHNKCSMGRWIFRLLCSFCFKIHLLFSFPGLAL